MAANLLIQQEYFTRVVVPAALAAADKLLQQEYLGPYCQYQPGADQDLLQAAFACGPKGT